MGENIADEKLPVTLWLTFEQIRSLYDANSQDVYTPNKTVSEALKTSTEFKQKSQDKLLQLHLTEAFLTQNQQMRTLLNQSAAALTTFQKNYEKDKKKIEKLKKQVKEGKKDREKAKSASLGGSNSLSQSSTAKDEDGEKKEHKSKHRRQKSMDSNSRRIASRSVNSPSKSTSKKDLTELVNGNKTST